MAGSKNWFRYASDAGTLYSVFLDESNCEALTGSNPLFETREDDYPLLPKGAKLRYCNAFLNANPVIKRKFYIGSQGAIGSLFTTGAITAAVYANPSDDAPVITQAWTVTSYRGEEFGIPPSVNATGGDTGLTDNDPGRDP